MSFKKAVKSCCLALALSLVLSAQQRHKVTIDLSTDEGKLLQEIGQAANEPAKQALMERFASKYPENPGLPWVSGQLQIVYLKQQEFDKVLEVGLKALAVDPDDLDVCYNNLKAAESKKDPDLVKIWSARTSLVARKIIGSRAQADEDTRQLIDYAKQVDTYTEYALYATALQMTDPAKLIDLTENLEQHNPRSQYLPKLLGKYLNALRLTGQAEKAGMRAELIAETDSSNEDVLMIAADYNLQRKSEPDKTILYSDRLRELLKTKPKPEGVSEADWNAKKQSMIALAYWMSGVSYSTEGKFAEADSALRMAMPNLADEQTRGIGLYHLGMANYQLGKAAKDKARMIEGLTYLEQSAGLKSPVQAQALKNIKALRPAVN